MKVSISTCFVRDMYSQIYRTQCVEIVFVGIFLFFMNLHFLYSFIQFYICLCTLQMFRGIYRVFTGKSDCVDFKITGIAGIHAIPIVFHLRYACKYCIKKICIHKYLTCYQLRIYRKSPQILQGYSHKLCHYMVSLQLVHDFPTSNVGYPHNIPVNQILFKYYNRNQSAKISKLQGLRV